MDMIGIEEDKQFLIKQRLKGREGCMMGVDVNLDQKEQRVLKRKQRAETRNNVYQEQPSTSTACNIWNTSDLSETEEEPQTDEEYTNFIPEAKRHQKIPCKKKNILTPRLAAALDKVQVSHRDAVHLLVAFLDAVGLNTSDYVLNRNTIRKQRASLRKEHSENIMQTFSVNDQRLIIHWDTKLLASISGKKEDRLAIIATAADVEQIIDMPAIPSGTGFEISSAVYDALQDNNILEKTEAFVFDTTSSNTGQFKGAAPLLEKAIGRNILFLGCRHHIFEIVLAAVFKEAKVESATGPDIQIFKRFQKFWPEIKQDNFIPGITHPRINEILRDDCGEILSFAYTKIEESFPRDDYREFLELVIIFLGGRPPRGIKFAKPGALHHARWMAKSIYCLKILIFRSEFLLMADSEVNGLIEVACFIIKCYTIYWFDANKAEKASLNDLAFPKKIRGLQNNQQRDW